jgi:hypothetical protein
MTAPALPSHSTLQPDDDFPALNSYGSLSRADDIEVLPSTSIITPSNSHNSESDSAIINRYKPSRTSCLKPQQSETVFALCLFTLGLGLLIYVIVSYWFTHSQISPIIIFICGLLCFIPGCYYLIENYCSFLKCQRNRHRHVPIVNQDDIV